jgi:hypothetical protein
MQFPLVLIVSSISAAIFIGHGAAAQSLTMTVGDPEQQALYLSGAAAALATANAYLPPGEGLYCPPQQYVLNAEEMRSLAAEQLVGANEPGAFIVAAVATLRDRFPCAQ